MDVDVDLDLEPSIKLADYTMTTQVQIEERKGETSDVDEREGNATHTSEDRTIMFIHSSIKAFQQGSTEQMATVRPLQKDGSGDDVSDTEDIVESLNEANFRNAKHAQTLQSKNLAPHKSEEYKVSKI